MFKNVVLNTLIIFKGRVNKKLIKDAVTLINRYVRNFHNVTVNARTVTITFGKFVNIDLMFDHAHYLGAHWTQTIKSCYWSPQATN